MKYRKNSGNTKHILVLGECGIESYLAFLEELYNADHGETNHDIVIMQRRQVKELMNLIKSFSYAPNIFYFMGNSLIEVLKALKLLNYLTMKKMQKSYGI